jgi:2-phosphosulfolactate phosphatase
VNSPDRSEYDVCCEWGLQGVLGLAPESSVIVIVDILSFSTAVDIAVANGASVLPCAWTDEKAAEFAASRNACLASSRAAGGYSLSPASLQSISRGAALVLPSPNGSTLSLSAGNATTLTACLRNCRAVAAKAAEYGPRIGVIPAGEQWKNGSLRPCLEDFIGAGAVIQELRGRRSPKAELAAATFERFRPNLLHALSRCRSGRELANRGFVRDIELAAMYGVSSAIPVLAGDRYADARARR